MGTKPRFENGILVPYNLSIAELATLIDSEQSNRWAAFVALGYKPEPEALEVLQNKLDSPDWSLRRAAAEAISYHRYGESAGSDLIRLLHDESQYVARTACQTLGKLKIGSSRNPVLSLLKSKDSDTRQVVLRTLCYFWQDIDFACVLKAMQADSCQDVRKEAAWTLWQCAEKPSHWNILFAA